MGCGGGGGCCRRLKVKGYALGLSPRVFALTGRYLLLAFASLFGPVGFLLLLVLLLHGELLLFDLFQLVAEVEFGRLLL